MAPGTGRGARGCWPSTGESTSSSCRAAGVPSARAEAGPPQGFAREGHAGAVRGGRPGRAAESPTVDYKATIDDPRIDEVRILRPQEIPTYVADGLFDLGITGRDWIEETACDVVSRWASSSTRRRRAARSASSSPSPTTRRTRAVEDLPARRAGLDRVPGLTRRFFESKGIDADIRLSLRRHRGQDARHRRLHRRDHRDRPGAACGRAQGSSTRSCISYTELVANPAAYEDPEKRTPWSRSARCCRACWRPAARSW